VHHADYLDFLAHAGDDWVALDPAIAAVDLSSGGEESVAAFENARRVAKQKAAWAAEQKRLDERRSMDRVAMELALCQVLQHPQVRGLARDSYLQKTLPARTVCSGCDPEGGGY
jgi:hypothetical protein